MKNSSKTALAVIFTILICVFAVVLVYSFAITDENTIVYEKTTFSDCGHTVGDEYPLPESLCGSFPEKSAESLGGVFKMFKNNVLHITRNENGYCENHFRTFIDGNSIKTEVLKTGRIISEYPTAPSQFSENDINMLESGIVTNSQEELSALLEDYTS